MASRPGPSGVSSSCAPSRKGSSASRASEPSRCSSASGKPSPSVSRNRASEPESPPPPPEQAVSKVEANKKAPKARDGFDIERPSGTGRVQLAGNPSRLPLLRVPERKRFEIDDPAERASERFDD